MITEQQFIAWNEQALLAGPKESESQFLERVQYCLNIQTELAEHLEGQLALGPQDLASECIVKEVFPQSRRFYGIAPHWIPIFFTNHKLSPWHGGCAWIFQLSDQSPTSALFQLRKALRTKKHYLGLFDRDEILVHEMAHVGRMMYDEPQFEEMLAYRSSPSSLRRLLGPLVQSSTESALFTLCLFLIILFDLFLVFFGYDILFFQAMALKIVPLGMIVWAAIRLYRRHRQYNAALAALKKIYGDEETARAVCYRLTDQEIIAFSTQSTEQIQAYIHDQPTHSLRWRQIVSCYK